MAPEIIKKEKYTTKVDIWSTGVIVYLLIKGELPFKSTGTKESLFDSIINDEINYDDDSWTQVSPHAKEFIRRTLEKDPDRRPDAETLLNHSWLKDFDIIRRKS